jgi:hypothetical protein
MDINRDSISFGFHQTKKKSRIFQTIGAVDVFNTRLGTSGATSRVTSACPNLNE